MNEFNEYIREVFSAAGDIVIKPMMGGYLVYFNGKLIGDVCRTGMLLIKLQSSKHSAQQLYRFLLFSNS